MKLHKSAARVLFVSVYVVFGIVIFVAAATILMKTVMTARARAKIEPAKVFAGYVLHPIPESVTNIKADQPRYVLGYRYTFRFNINRNDLGLLIDSQPFAKVWNVEYANGNLSWYFGRDCPLGIDIYTHGRWLPCYDYTRAPSWFRPDLWENPEAYAVWKEGNLVNIETSGRDSGGPVEIRVLLYNEDEGEAYFIVDWSE
jgi:hypothetical protein